MKLIYLYLKSESDDDSVDKKNDLPVKGPRQTGQPFIVGWDLGLKSDIWICSYFSAMFAKTYKF